MLTHFLATFPRRRRSAKGVAAIEKALGLGYSAAELCEAIDGNAADGWHIDRKKHELEYVLRDAGKIDTFRELARAAGEPLVDAATGLLNARGARALGVG